VRNPGSIPAEYLKSPEGQRGRYILHRAPRLQHHIGGVAPGDRATAHNHETWGVIGVIENEIEETRLPRDGGGAGPRGARDAERHAHAAGGVSRLVPGDEVHGMYNPTARDTDRDPRYGKDLAGLKRRRWEADGRRSRSSATDI